MKEGTMGASTKQHQIPDEEVRDWIITAVEGGINYWAAVEDYDPDAGTVTVHEYEDGAPDFRFARIMNIEVTEKPVATHKLDVEKMRTGIHRLARASFQRRSLKALLEDYDAADADAALQLALLGEVRFG